MVPEFDVWQQFRANLQDVLPPKLGNSKLGGFFTTHLQKYALKSNWIKISPRDRIGVKI